MSQQEAKRQWIIYTSLADKYHEMADSYKRQVGRATPVLFTEQVARLAEQKANRLSRSL